MSFIPETFKDCAKDYIENAEKVSHSIYKFEFLNCRCTDFFGTQDACSVKWSYFCREIAISGFGVGLKIRSIEFCVLFSSPAYFIQVKNVSVIFTLTLAGFHSGHTDEMSL